MTASTPRPPKRKRQPTELAPILGDTEQFAMICGLPTSLTYLATDFARDLMHRAYGECNVIGLNDLSAETRRKLTKVNGHILALAEIPDADIAKLANDEQFSLLVIDQNFQQACRDFMAMRNVGLLETARTLSRAQIGICPLAGSAQAKVLSPKLDDPASQFVTQIADAFEIEGVVRDAIISDRELDRSLADLLTLHFPNEWPDLPSDMERILRQLDSFYGLQTPRNSEPWDLPIELLVEGRSPHLPATQAMDLVGPARCLSFGPYCNLPAGRWMGWLEFTSSDNTPSNVLGFDLIADHEVKVDEQFEVSKSGAYRYKFDFEIVDPYSPIEMRTFVRRGAIFGNFRLDRLGLQLIESAG